MAIYKILSFDKYTGSLVVQFAENMTPINIDVPLNNDNLFITGQELDQYIQGFIPTWHMERLEKLKSGITNANEIENLVASTSETNLPLIPEAPQMTAEELSALQMRMQLAEEQRIAKILVRLGVLATDPTEIPTGAL
jgi:hypothetical protein